MSNSLTSGTFPRAASGSGLSLRRFGRQVWAVLEAIGNSRARPHLEALARQYDVSNPGLARRLRESARHSLVD